MNAGLVLDLRRRCNIITVGRYIHAAEKLWSAYGEKFFLTFGLYCDSYYPEIRASEAVFKGSTY